MSKINMNFLTYDIINIILKNVTIDNTPLLTYRLKYVNKSFYNFICNENYKICKYLNDKEEDLDILYKNGNIQIYNWLYCNNINITYKNVIGLIQYNRYDILKYSLKFKNNINIIFNRFYLTYHNNDIHNIFNIFNNGKSFLIYACENNSKDICDFFLNSYDENNKRYTCYDKEIELCMEYASKNNNINILKYLINNHLDKI